MQDLMRIYATNEGRTKLDNLNSKKLREGVVGKMYGAYTIKKVSLASNSSYEPSTNTISYGKGFSWFIR